MVENNIKNPTNNSDQFDRSTTQFPSHIARTSSARKHKAENGMPFLEQVMCCMPDEVLATCDGKLSGVTMIWTGQEPSQTLVTSPGHLNIRSILGGINLSNVT